MYSGSEILTNQYMNVTRTVSDGVRERIAFRTIPAIFPNSERKISFMVSPSTLRNSTFNVDIVGNGANANLHWSSESDSDSEPESEQEQEQEQAKGVSSSSGGCDSGTAPFIALLMSVIFAARRKR